MKKFKKWLNKIILVLIVNFIVIASNSKAAFVDPSDYKPPAIGNAGKVETIGNTIIGGIQFLGSIVSVIVLIIIGIKFIIGSTEEKAEYKETMMPYIIGAIMVFSIANILGIVSEIIS